MIPITLLMNGRPRSLTVEPHHTLLDVLRADLGLTGTKECCLVGECGACTVRLNGAIVDSCLVLAVEADGGEIQTVEGLAAKGGGFEALSPLQEAFLTHGAVQCGFCIPGQLMAADDLLRRSPEPSRAEIEEGLAGNLCRCGCYYQIFDAVEATAKRLIGADVLTADIRTALKEIFLRHGAVEPVRVLVPIDGDEAIFFVGSGDILAMDGRSAMSEITSLLTRKILITTDGPAWVAGKVAL